MKAWKDMTRIERMRAEYSDLHKDVYGMRPRNYDEISSWADEKLEAEFDFLVNLLKGD